MDITVWSDESVNRYGSLAKLINARREYADEATEKEIAKIQNIIANSTDEKIELPTKLAFTDNSAEWFTLAKKFISSPVEVGNSLGSTKVQTLTNEISNRNITRADWYKKYVSPNTDYEFGKLFEEALKTYNIGQSAGKTTTTIRTTYSPYSIKTMLNTVLKKLDEKHNFYEINIAPFRKSKDYVSVPEINQLMADLTRSKKLPIADIKSKFENLKSKSKEVKSVLEKSLKEGKTDDYEKVHSQYITEKYQKTESREKEIKKKNEEQAKLEEEQQKILEEEKKIKEALLKKEEQIKSLQKRFAGDNDKLIESKKNEFMSNFEQVNPDFKNDPDKYLEYQEKWIIEEEKEKKRLEDAYHRKLQKEQDDLEDQKKKLQKLEEEKSKTEQDIKKFKEEIRTEGDDFNKMYEYKGYAESVLQQEKTDKLVSDPRAIAIIIIIGLIIFIVLIKIWVFFGGIAFLLNYAYQRALINQAAEHGVTISYSWWQLLSRSALGPLYIIYYLMAYGRTLRPVGVYKGVPQK